MQAPTLFKKLRAARHMEKEHLPFIQTLEDRDIVLEIGFHAERNAPIGVKQLNRLGITSEGTIGRRLKRLKTLGVVKYDRSEVDGRKVELSLHPRIHAAWRRVYGWLK